MVAAHSADMCGGYRAVLAGAATVIAQWHGLPPPVWAMTAAAACALTLAVAVSARRRTGWRPRLAGMTAPVVVVLGTADSATSRRRKIVFLTVRRRRRSSYAPRSRTTAESVNAARACPNGRQPEESARAQAGLTWQTLGGAPAVG